MFIYESRILSKKNGCIHERKIRNAFLNTEQNLNNYVSTAAGILGYVLFDRPIFKHSHDSFWQFTYGM